MGSTPWPSGLERRNIRSCHLVLWSRNHEYSPLREMTDLIVRVWVRSLGTILGRCQAPKTARPVGRFPLIVFYVFILLKTYSILYLYLHTHQHTSKHTTWHFIQNPKIHLSCFSYHYKPQHTSIMVIISSHPIIETCTEVVRNIFFFCEMWSYCSFCWS